MDKRLDNFPKLLAVYGSLKMGKHNHHIIQGIGLQFVGKTYTEKSCFHLQGGKSFPIARTGGTKHLLCELYEFNNFTELKRIDELEQHPTWYQRKVFKFNNQRYGWMYVQKGLSHSRYSKERIFEDKGIQSWI